MKPKFLLFILFFLPFLSACNSTDDVGRIFTGKQWKLTGIWEEKKPEMADIWGGDASKKKESLKLLNRDNNYLTITFTGSEDNDIITGNFTGQVVTNLINGSWTADGEKNTFKIPNMKPSTTSDKDILAQKYFEGLINANRYSGDENNLYLYFTDSASKQTLRLAFSPSTKKN